MSDTYRTIMSLYMIGKCSEKRRLTDKKKSLRIAANSEIFPFLIR